MRLELPPLRSEREVMASWRLDRPPQVSVLCSSYKSLRNNRLKSLVFSS